MESTTLVKSDNEVVRIRVDKRRMEKNFDKNYDKFCEILSTDELTIEEGDDPMLLISPRDD